MKKSIVLVDDSSTIRLCVSSFLTKAGFVVDKASSAEEVLQKFELGIRPDLLITDQIMPGMSGVDLIRKVRHLDSHKSMPILILSLDSHPDARQDAKAAGANGWVVKPVSAHDLLSAISLVID